MQKLSEEGTSLNVENVSPRCLRGEKTCVIMNEIAAPYAMIFQKLRYKWIWICIQNNSNVTSVVNVSVQSQGYNGILTYMVVHHPFCVHIVA